MPNKLKGEFAGTGIYSILRLVPVGIIILESPNGKITYANDRAIELYGVNPIGLETNNHSTKMMKLFKINGETYPTEKLPANRVTTKAKGQGFGLAVVKKLTEALNGNVTFESEIGKGTRFNIELPLSISPAN